MKKIKLKINGDNLPLLVSKLDELNKINDSIRMKIDSEHIFMYAKLGTDKATIAFKNFKLNTSDYFTNCDDIQKTYDINISNSKTLVKNLQTIKVENNILEITYNDSKEDVALCDKIQISNGKVKFNWLMAEDDDSRDFNKNNIEKLFNKNNAEWSIKINEEDFTYIKKLSGINSDKIINVSIVKGDVNISEKKLNNLAWEINVDKIESSRNKELHINKKFIKILKCSGEYITIEIHPAFMLIREDDSNLMLGFEQDSDDEDDD